MELLIGSTQATALGDQAIAAAFRLLVNDAALNDSAVDTRDVVTFEVWGDGRRLWQSRPLRRAAESDDCDIDVRVTDLLELRVMAAGDYWGRHAVWVEPRVLVAR